MQPSRLAARHHIKHCISAITPSSTSAVRVTPGCGLFGLIATTVAGLTSCRGPTASSITSANFASCSRRQRRDPKKMIKQPLILYVPGLLPKPDAETHRDALLRCLLAGLRRVDHDVANAIEGNEHSFDIVSWSFDFYAEHRDFSIDAAAVVDVTEQSGATGLDMAEATSWRRRFGRWLYTLGDLMPFLIPHVANERMELHLRDLMRYTRDQNGIAEHTRQMLKIPLRAATEARRPVLLIAHSMGSVIAFEALVQTSHDDQQMVSIDLLLTMGSPLGQRYIRNRLIGHEEEGILRYPNNVRRWINLAAVGDLTAIDPILADDFAPMVETGLIESIDDREVQNYFRLNGELNVHAEYGYIANTTTARIVADWWHSQHDKPG